MRQLLLSLSASFLMMLSCNKKETPTYSCDAVVNTFVISHIDSIQTISRDSLVTLSLPMQYGIFRALTPENKIRIYSEKIVELLSTIDPSVGGDYQHLENLVNLLNPSIYLDTILPNTLLVWQAYAKDSLGWSDQKMFAYVETWLMPDEFLGADRFVASQDCDCLYDAGCIGDCKSEKCNSPTKGGCGLAGTSNCTKICSETIKTQPTKE